MNVKVGGGGSATLTVTDIVVGPPGPLQSRVYVAVLNREVKFTEPESA